MRPKNHIILAVASLLLITGACGTKRSVPEPLIGVKDIVARLDSAVTAMHGLDPRDSSAILQQTYDEARITWNEFKRHCDEDNYEEALTVYLGDGNDNKKNAGDFLVFLKHSSQRFVFFSQVLLPMMKEFKGEKTAIDDYINNLQLEKVMEDGTIAMNAETTGYVPEVYPYVIRELGSALVSVDKMDEAQDLFNDYINAIYLQTENALYANFAGTYYAASLYLLDEKPEWALGTWENFKDYLEENKADYEAEELEICLQHIEQEIAKINNRSYE